MANFFKKNFRATTISFLELLILIENNLSKYSDAKAMCDLLFI